MKVLRFRFFGHPLVEFSAGKQLSLSGIRQHQLLAYLAVRGVWQRRDEVAFLFWPDSTNKEAFGNLRNLLHKVRVLAPYAPLEATQHTLRLEVASDLADFVFAVDRHDWEEVARLDFAELLQGFEHGATEPYLAWLREERQKRLDQWKGAIKRLLDGQRLTPEAREILAQSWTRTCPFDEDAVEARMRLAHVQHRSAAAAQIFLAFQRRLQAELGVSPSLELRRLATELSVQGVKSSSEMKAADNTPTPQSEPDSYSIVDSTSPLASLKIRDSTITGRRFEVKQLCGFLKSERHQLIMLTGTGGVGKSALITALYRQWVDQGEQGTFLVDVSSASNGRSALGLIATALGISVPEGTNLVEAVVDGIGDGNWIVMVDGAEQPDIAPLLTFILERCPNTRWLLASRRRLEIEVAQLVRLEGFPLPDVEEHDPEMLKANDGVNFLANVIERSGRHLNFAHDAVALAAIVRIVEGLPLALKLLGKLAQLYTPQQLLNILQMPSKARETWADSVELTDLMPSLLTCFQRSWELLEATEKRALARLAAFPADFEIAAGLRVARTELPVLTSLMDCSLLRADGAARLSLHAAIRSCLHVIAPQGAIDAAPDYVDYYSQRLKALADVAKGKTLRPLHEFLRSDRVNADYAWERALERRNYKALLAQQEALWFVPSLPGGHLNFDERCVAAEMALRDDPEVPSGLRAILLAGVAQSQIDQGRHAATLDFARRALRHAQQAHCLHATLSAQRALIYAHAYLGNAKEAELLIARQEALLASVSDGVFALQVPECRAILAFIEGKLEEALKHYETAARAARRVEDRRAELIYGFNIAATCHRLGRSARATGIEEPLFSQISHEQTDKSLAAFMLCELTQWHVHSGNVGRAGIYNEQVKAITDAYPQKLDIRLRVRLGEAALAVARKDFNAARVPIAHVLSEVIVNELPLVAAAALVIIAKWFRGVRDTPACLDAIRILRSNQLGWRTYIVADAMRRELGEILPKTDLPAVRGDLVFRAICGA